MERDKLIRKLKTVKNPRERDRIIWALAGKEKDALEETPAQAQPGKTNSAPVREQMPGLPKLPIDARKLVNYLAPAIFIFFGLVNLVQGIGRFIETGLIEAALPQLILGIMFFIFGFFSIAKAKKRVQGVNADKKEA
ncbi:MAG: hypothetical protein ABSG75_00820 [Syntrophales bacterium]|jgi:hypothetical protein